MAVEELECEEEEEAIEQDKLVEAWLASVPSITVEIAERRRYESGLSQRSGLEAARMRLAWATAGGSSPLPCA